MVPLAALLVAACLFTSLDAGVVKRQLKEDCPDKCKNEPLDISFIVDGSASIWPDNFTLGLWFVQNFVDKFQIGQDKVRVSMVTYGDRVYAEDSFGFTAHSNKASLNEAIDSIPYRSGLSTETGEAISWFMSNQLPQVRPNVRHVVIVLTDGNSQQPLKTKAEAHKALDQGLDVFAIGVGHEVSEQELHNIASDARHVFKVGSYKMLEDIMLRLAYETCGSAPEPPCQFDPVDIAFVIDSSVSIGERNFTLGLEFINEFLSTFTINPSSIRVAAIMFGDRVYREKAIPFDMYGNKEDTLEAILALPWMHGPRTETGAGIDYMVQNFVPHTRSHAAHVAIVLTDGESQNPMKTAESAQIARNSGMVMYAVGVGNLGGNLDEGELTNIAGDRARVLTADNYAMLNTIKATLTDITCEGIYNSLQEQRRVYATPPISP